MHCFSCNKDEQVPPGGAFAICPECYHVYPSPEDLKKAYLRKAFEIFKVDMKGNPKGGIVLYGRDGKVDDFIPWSPPRFMRLMACWFMIRSVFRDPNKISFCQECIHDF